MEARREALRGYSHNVRYHTRVYHVQTALAGIPPEVVSHLFVEGMIVSTRRSACPTDDLGRVQPRMKEQHRQMLRELRRGDFDERVVMLLGRLRVSDADPWEAPPPPEPPPPPASPAEARAIRRGRRISRELAPLAGQPPGEIPIPLEHPAFSGIPMIEWDETERTDSLELDLGAIDQLDLDEATTGFVRDDEGSGGELDLDALYDDEDDEALLAAFPSPVPEADAAQDEPERPRPKEWDPPTPVEPDTEPPLARRGTDELPRRSKHPSLPLPKIGEEVDEAFFHGTPVDEELPGRELGEAEREFADKRQLKTLTFPPPFEQPDTKRRGSSDTDKDE